MYEKKLPGLLTILDLVTSQNTTEDHRAAHIHGMRAPQRKSNTQPLNTVQHPAHLFCGSCGEVLVNLVSFWCLSPKCQSFKPDLTLTPDTWYALFGSPQKPRMNYTSSFCTKKPALPFNNHPNETMGQENSLSNTQ